MMLEIRDNQILVVNEYLSDRQPNGKAILKEQYVKNGVSIMYKIVDIIVDKIRLNIEEEIVVRLQYNLFNLEEDSYEIDVTNENDFSAGW